jgi:hypothetical protein
LASLTPTKAVERVLSMASSTSPSGIPRRRRDSAREPEAMSSKISSKADLGRADK